MLLGLAAALCIGSGAPSAGAAALPAYTSEAELAQALARWRDRAAQLRERRSAPSADGSLAMQAAPAAPAAKAEASKSADAAAESITHVQTAGVDEGGIVKRAGDHLVILRRGRLFSVRVGDDALQPVAMVDAYAPGADPRGAWYDELLVSGSTVVVVGYSYARGGTEIGLFELAPDGALAHRATYHLRSFDYYSSRNYASRLIGRKLVFYTPTLLHPWGRPWTDAMPGLRRWHADAVPAEFERILPATRIHRTNDDFDPSQPLALHTVTSCDLSAATAMRCESTAVLGPAGRVFYVSQGSVYVWTHAMRAPRPMSAVFRIPLDGAAPTGLKTAGVPIDQLSFLEDAGDHLNVLLRASGSGEGMWGSERTHGSMALLRVPLSIFGDGSTSAQREHYRTLPSPAGFSVQNRFVGDWLLWGGHAGGDRTRASAWALRYAAADASPNELEPGHAVERIEPMGPHALLVGNEASDLHFTSVRLQGDAARIAGRHVQPAARQGETRTHGFYFRATGRDEGLLGLPVMDPAAGGRHGVHSGAQGSASVLFLRQRDLAFSHLGQLHAQPAAVRDDACKASCVDWYGNARPIFLGERVFALLGYELVEGRLAGASQRERIEERRRIAFLMPQATWREGRYSPFN
jgi:hypothetical protein